MIWIVLTLVAVLVIDVASLTLETAPVGYHAEQVDDTLDALEARLREQEEELRAWRSP